MSQALTPENQRTMTMTTTTMTMTTRGPPDDDDNDGTNDDADADGDDVDEDGDGDHDNDHDDDYGIHLTRKNLHVVAAQSIVVTHNATPALLLASHGLKTSASRLTGRSSRNTLPQPSLVAEAFWAISLMNASNTSGSASLSSATCACCSSSLRF